MNTIVRCLMETARVLNPGASPFATCFEAPGAAYLLPMQHEPGGITSHYDADPHHYCLDEMRWMGELAGRRVEAIGEWGHPRGQRMLAFRREA